MFKIIVINTLGDFGRVLIVYYFLNCITTCVGLHVPIKITAKQLNYNAFTRIKRCAVVSLMFDFCMEFQA